MLTTPYGDFTVQGDAMVRMRTNELKALELLEKPANSESFGQALAQAGLNPIIFTGEPDHQSDRHRCKTPSPASARVSAASAPGLANAGQTPDKPDGGTFRRYQPQT